MIENMLGSSVAAMTQLMLRSPPSVSTNCSTLHPACGVDASSSSLWTAFNLSMPLPSPHFDFVQTIASSANASADDKAELCTASRMQNTWRTNIAANGTSNIVSSQYYVGQSNNVALYPPSSSWVNCTDIPTLKPFYAVSAPKDVVIAIDVSANDADAVERVEMAKASALQLLLTLSSRDYVGVLLYSDYALRVTPVLVQATRPNVARLADSIHNITIGTAGSGALLAGALRASVTLLATSADLGLTSSCTATVVLLSGGRDDQPFDDPVTVAKSHPEVVVFAVVLLPPATQPSLANSTTLRRITCAGVGVTAVAAGRADNMTRTLSARSAVLIFTAYLAQRSSRAARWSSSSLDGEAKFSASQPVFRADGGLQGMLVVDVPTTVLTFGSNLSVDDVDAVLQRRTPCLPLLDRASGAADACIALDLSTPVDGAPAPLTTGVLIGLFTVLGSIIVAMPTVCECGLCVVRNVSAANGSGSPSREAMCLVWLSRLFAFSALLAPMLAWAICMAIFWTTVSDDMLQRSEYERVTYSVIRRSANAYPCCEEQACSCESTSSPTGCSLLVAMNQPGSCSSSLGWSCCPSACRAYRNWCRCAFVTYTCQSVCGSCAAPSIAVRYTTRRHGTQTSWLVRFCGMDDVTCRDAWLRQAATGTGWAALDNPNDFHFDLPLNMPAVVATGILGFVAIVLAVSSLLCVIFTHELSYRVMVLLLLPQRVSRV